ncbi:MAG: HD-GYP domain-containing protein [candidate division Zixibacteria bacterium]|nr:HD-GYP domain-containing protein [candidate division Zixibacteria bacterium]
MPKAEKTETAIDRFMPVQLDSLRIDSILDFDLYVRAGTDYVLYRASNMPFTEENRSGLLRYNVKVLYVAGDKRRQYQEYLETNIKSIVLDPTIEENAKAGIVYDSAKLLVKDVLDNPTLGNNIRRSQSLVDSTVAFILTGRNAFHSLLRVMSFDYYTYSHSVNVCTFSLALAQFMGIEDVKELCQLGTGALLHDVGKTMIPEAVLQKRSQLSDREWELIKAHPQWGVDILKETGLIEEESYYPVLEHHEREDGSGYPRGLRSGEIHAHSKIVAIADVFDAMTTRRVYRSAVAPFVALKEIFDQEGVFDRSFLENFTLLMGPAGQHKRS